LLHEESLVKEPVDGDRRQHGNQKTRERSKHPNRVARKTERTRPLRSIEYLDKLRDHAEAVLFRVQIPGVELGV
jgi:hypothetical protein